MLITAKGRALTHSSGALGFVLALASLLWLSLAPHHGLLALEKRIPVETEPVETEPLASEEGKLIVTRRTGHEAHFRREVRREGALRRRLRAASPAPDQATDRPPFASGSPVFPPLLC